MGKLFDSIEKNMLENKLSKKSGNNGNNGNKSELSSCDTYENNHAKELVTEESNGNRHGVSMRKCSIHCVTTCGNWPLIAVHEMQRKKDPDYPKLAASGIDDLYDGVCIKVAFFLHALHTVRSCEDAEFEPMCRKFVRHWRKRLEPKAWAIVGGEIKARLKTLGIVG